MKKISALIATDLKNIFRDDILQIMFYAPILLMLVLFFGLPPLLNAVPELLEFEFLIVTALCLITVSFPAFVFSFIMLDEKDEGIFVVLKILPMSATKFFLYRMSFVILFAFFFGSIILIIYPLPGMKVLHIFPMAFLFSLLPPVLCLATIIFARNKIEGVTMMKFLNFIIFIPIVAFFVDSPWKHLFGLIPAFWTYQLSTSFDSPSLFFAYFIGGALYHIVLIFFLFRSFFRKVY